MAAEKALGGQGAGPGRCLGATARGRARRWRAARAAPRLCLGARSPRRVGSCREPRAEARVPFTMGVTRVSGRLNRLPSFRRAFPLLGAVCSVASLASRLRPESQRRPQTRSGPARPRQRPDAPRRAERMGTETLRSAECGVRGRENSQQSCASVRGGEGRRWGRGNRAREDERGAEKEVERAAQPNKSQSAEPGRSPGRGACPSGQTPPLGPCGQVKEPEE